MLLHGSNTDARILRYINNCTFWENLYGAFSEVAFFFFQNYPLDKYFLDLKNLKQRLKFY